jgi:hypothetical protein
MKKFMFVLVVLLALVGTSNVFAQAVTSASCIVSCDVSGTPLTVAMTQDLTVSLVSVGQPVALVPDGAGAFVDPGNSAYLSAVIGGSTVGIFEVTGDPNSAVIVSFALPYILYSSSGLNGAVYVSYNGTSADWSEGTEFHYFNPNLPETMWMTADGATATIVELGGIFTVAPNSAADVYIADAICTVAYAAN